MKLTFKPGPAGENDPIYFGIWKLMNEFFFKNLFLSSPILIVELLKRKKALTQLTLISVLC